MQFGAKSERLPEEQLQLGLEALEQSIAQTEAEAEKRDPTLRSDRAAKRRASRGALPAHLPRSEVTLLPEDTACPCCRTAMTMIGEDRSERLDVIPAQYRVIVTRRPKLACRACTGTVEQAPAPARLIEGGMPTEALVAQVAVARYADHQPLYRQSQMMQLQCVIIERSTLSSWMGYAAAEVAPVVARLREMLLASARIFADETIVPVLMGPIAQARWEPRSGARADQAGLLLGDRPRRPALGRLAASCGGLQLRPRPRAHPCNNPARQLPRHPAMRRLWGLQGTERRQVGQSGHDPGVLLEPRTAGILCSGVGFGAVRLCVAAVLCW